MNDIVIIGLLTIACTLALAVLGFLWKLSARLTKLETQVTPFWAAFQKQVADALHHPHPESQIMDRLLEKLKALTITPGETLELKGLLRKIVDDPGEDPRERQRAQLLLFAMPRVIEEAKGK